MDRSIDVYEVYKYTYPHLYVHIYIYIYVYIIAPGSAVAGTSESNRKSLSPAVPSARKRSSQGLTTGGLCEQLPKSSLPGFCAFGVWF